MTNNTDFAISFNALRTQAKFHGVDPNTEEMRKFLIQTAEVIAQLHAENRSVMKIVHKSNCLLKSKERQ